MSKARKRGHNPWHPRTGPTSTRPRIEHGTQPDGRALITAYGDDASLIAMVQTFRDTGARRVTFGWEAPGYGPEDEPPPAGVPVTWWCKVAYPGGVVEGRYGPTVEHRRAVVEAAAQILREAGATVTIMVPEAN